MKKIIFYKNIVFCLLMAVTTTGCNREKNNLLRQQKTKGGTVEFNVSGLTDGVYYLHVYDGVSETPEMRQIVVEH